MLRAHLVVAGPHSSGMTSGNLVAQRGKSLKKLEEAALSETSSRNQGGQAIAIKSILHATTGRV